MEQGEESKLREQMRRLWLQRVMWTRMLIVSMLAELGDTAKIHNKLLKIQQNIGITFGNYFRDESIPKRHIKELMDQETYSNLKLTPDEKKLIDRHHAGNMLSAMLIHRIVDISKYVVATKNGDTTIMETATSDYAGNNASIALFLSGLKTSWNEQELLDLLNKSQTETERQISARVAEDYDADFEACEKAIDISLMIADALTDGVVKESLKTEIKKEGTQ